MHRWRPADEHSRKDTHQSIGDALVLTQPKVQKVRWQEELPDEPHLALRRRADSLGHALHRRALVADVAPANLGTEVAS